jgi:hypothetical protein
MKEGVVAVVAVQRFDVSEQSACAHGVRYGGEQQAGGIAGERLRLNRQKSSSRRRRAVALRGPERSRRATRRASR